MAEMTRTKRNKLRQNDALAEEAVVAAVVAVVAVLAVVDVA